MNNETKAQPVDVLAVELRRIPQGGKFTLRGDSESVYTRGPYRRSEREFLVRHAASMTHSYLPVDAVVIPWGAK
jgi:hypothetical protein